METRRMIISAHRQKCVHSFSRAWTRHYTHAGHGETVILCSVAPACLAWVCKGSQWAAGSTLRRSIG